MTTFDHIETKLPFGYEYLGELTVKNIARPIGAYKVLMQTRITGEKVKTKPKRRAADRYKNIVAGALIVVVIIVVGLIWNLSFTGNHLLCERYDRELKDLFALQDDIKMKVMTATRVKLTEGDYARAFEKGTKNLQAYLKAMESYQHRQHMTREGQARARQLAEEAIALDPGYAMAYCHLAAALGNEATMGFYKNVPEVLARSMELAQKAVALDDLLAQAHITLGFQYTLRRDFDLAIDHGERAVALEPNSAEIVAGLAAMLEWADRPEPEQPLSRIEDAGGLRLGTKIT